MRDDDFFMNLYWFWYKYIQYKNINNFLPERFNSQFNKILEIYTIKYLYMPKRSMRVGKRWNGQTKSEFDKNYKRVNDIIGKAKVIKIK